MRRAADREPAATVTAVVQLANELARAKRVDLMDVRGRLDDEPDRICLQRFRELLCQAHRALELCATVDQDVVERRATERDHAKTSDDFLEIRASPRLQQDTAPGRHAFTLDDGAAPSRCHVA